MDIFKLIFEHDITLEHLSGNEDPRNLEKGRDAMLATFLKPQQTYNRYYFTGTRIREERFGLSVLAAYPEIVKTLDRVFADMVNARSESFSEVSGGKQDVIPETSLAAGWHRSDGSRFEDLTEEIREMQPYEMLISGRSSEESTRNEFVLDEQIGIREHFKPLTRLLDRDHLVLISEKAHHGIDLHLFSRRNLYEQLFHSYQKMVKPEFRYFSINGKRIGSERQFYFETWTLNRPPHGFQEVTQDARIR